MMIIYCDREIYDNEEDWFLEIVDEFDEGKNEKFEIKPRVD